MDRRQFLKDSAIGAGVIGASLHVGEASSPKNEFRIGIVGSTGRGNYGHGLDTVWKSIKRANVVAVADDNADGLAAAVKRTGAANGYADYRRMLEEENLDIVAVCPRWIDRHHEMLMGCAEHDCHVYTEKPFCRTLAECDDVVEAFEKRGLKFGIAHVNRYRPELSVVKSLLENGEIGEILEVRGRGKEDSRGGGEDLWVLGTHILDLMRSLVGDVESCFARVRANGKPISKADVYNGREGIGPLAGDSLDAMFRFRSGVTGYFASHRNQAGNPSRFAVRVFGSKGIIELPSIRTIHLLRDGSWSPGRSGQKWIPVTANGVGKEASGNSSHGNEAAVEDLIHAIDTDGATQSNVLDARAATELIASIFESQRVGGPVSLPLKNRQNPLTLLG